MTWVDTSAPTGPASDVETLNYDLGTGLQIAFPDLFNDPATALSIISIQAAAQLGDELGADYDSTLVAQGTSPTSDNYLHWSLTPDGIQVTFGEFQVSDKTGLMPTIQVPWGLIGAGHGADRAGRGIGGPGSATVAVVAGDALVVARLSAECRATVLSRAAPDIGASCP